MAQTMEIGAPHRNQSWWVAAQSFLEKNHSLMQGVDEEHLPPQIFLRDVPPRSRTHVRFFFAFQIGFAFRVLIISQSNVRLCVTIRDHIMIGSSIHIYHTILYHIMSRYVVCILFCSILLYCSVSYYVRTYVFCFICIVMH